MKKLLTLNIYLLLICVTAFPQTAVTDAAAWTAKIPVLILFTSTVVFTQDDKQSAINVVNKLFEGMKAKNAEQIKSVFSAEGQLIAIDKPRDGKGISKTRVFTAESFAKAISEANGGDFIEKMPNKNVEISGDMAIVSGRYTFYVGDKFSHCGTNTFNLVRTETGWLIANAASTLEFQCERDLKAVEIPIIEANPKDVSTIDGIIKAFYETISGGKGCTAPMVTRPNALYPGHKTYRND